jgi:hypothetical protein
MSTKIFGGVRYIGDHSSVFHHMQELRPKIWNAVYVEQRRMLALSSTRMFDIHNHENPDTPKRFWDFISKAQQDFDDRVREIKKTGYRDPSVDFEVKLMVLPHTINGTLYGMLFVEHPKLRAMVRRQHWIKDYHYQNQTDRPKSVSAGDWEQRKRIWDDLLPSDDPAPITHGYTYDLSKPDWMWPRYHSIYRWLPPADYRARELASYLAGKDFMKSREKPPEVSEVIAFHHSDEYYDAVDKYRYKLVTKIKDISRQDVKFEAVVRAVKETGLAP